MYIHFKGKLQDIDNDQVEHYILASRRKELKMTQQQVAEQAGMQLRQYQRLELGERNITGSTGRVLLAICDVLKLDPYGAELPGRMHCRGVVLYTYLGFCSEGRVPKCFL